MKPVVVALIMSLFAQVAEAQNNLGPGIPTVESFIKEFRDQIRSKVEELHQNYKVDFTSNSVTFYSNESVSCSNHGTASVGSAVGRITYGLQAATGSLAETIRYFTCNNELVFTETFRTKGINIIPLDKNELFSGDVRLKLAEDESERIYTLTDSDSKEIVKVLHQRTSSGTRAHFFITQKEGISFEQSTGNGYEQAFYKLHTQSLVYTRFNGTVTLNFSKVGPYFLAAKIYPNGQKTYLENTMKISFSDFTMGMNHTARYSTIDAATRIVARLISELPQTTFVSSGITTSRLLDELKLTLKYLETGNHEPVKNLILEFIKAAKDGLLVDNRKEDHAH